MKEEKEIAIVVFTFEGYKDIWPAFLCLMKKYKNIPLKVYFTYYDDANLDYDATFLKINKNISWTERLLNTLLMIKEDYILLFLEDYFITKNINANEFLEVMEYILKNKVLYYKFRLPPFSIKYSKKFKIDKHRYYINEKRKYGLSIQPGVWNRIFLLDLLSNQKMSAWDFEHYLNKINVINHNNASAFVFDSRNLLNIEHAIIKEKYTRKAYKILIKENIIANGVTREKVGMIDSLVLKIKGFLRYIVPGITNKRG